MTGNKVLLDANIVIELFKGDRKIFEFLEQQTMYIATAVLAELYLGAYRSANEQRHQREIKDFLLRCNVLNADPGTAENAALVPINPDIAAAATTVRCGMYLIL